MSHTFAIGDIHGCHVQLENLLDMIELEWPGGTVVFLGDYVDRGPQSRQVVERIMAGPHAPGWRWIALKGNHEEMMVSALRDGVSPTMWLMNGGDATLESFGGIVPEAVIDWMAGLPMIHTDRNRIFVHAGIDAALPLDAQDPHTLLWQRPLPGVSGNYGGRHLVHGHTPLAENPLTTGNRTNIDTACVYGGSLTVAMFDDVVPGSPRRFISIPNRAVS